MPPLNINPTEINKLHDYDDKDVSPASHHHTLGNKATQAMPGDGGKFLLKGVTITGAKGGNVALASVIAALVKLGAKDSTTA